MKPMYRSTSTLTSKGNVHHQLHMPSGVMAPVKLEVDALKPTALHPPQTRDGRNVHALPGGSEFLA